MKFTAALSILAFVAPALAESVSVSCQTVPSPTLEATPYSSTTRSVMHNGVSEEMVFEYYRSVTYVSSCGPLATPGATSTITYF
ncbi:Aga2 protein [Maudiozyma humilis]|uniref:Aga2 protein n=1 Tax=Maudiozyma humilis TaxID=51915 RepID=A0AAV5S4M3_MAUHU|nr:Aga2 protein [Kazachstania humilis]